MTFGFGNIQVFVGDKDPYEIHGKIIQALRERARDDLYEESPEVDFFEADRLFIVGPVVPEPWIAVWDYYKDWEMYFDLWEVAQDISRSILEPTLSMYLRDSAVLRLDLFDNGVLIDKRTNYPDEFGAVNEADVRAFAGNPTVWERFLAPGATPTDLRNEWIRHGESAVWNITRLFGMNRDNIGYCDLNVIDKPDYTILKFRATPEWYDRDKKLRLT